MQWIGLQSGARTGQSAGRGRCGEVADRRAALKAIAAVAALGLWPGKVLTGENGEMEATENCCFTTNGDVPIRYAVLGEGEPLVLLHGFTDSVESWAELGYLEPLLAAGRRLVLIDARGHGGSGRSHDPAAYAPRHRAADVAAVLDALDIECADLFGYSMGGWSALVFARFFPDRLGRLIVGGAHPFGQSMALYREAVAFDIHFWIALLERLHGGPLPEAWKTRIAANDLAALQAAVAEDRPDISAALAAGPERPCLFYVGAKDPLRESVARSARLLPGACFFEVPDCNHLTALLRTDLVLPRILAFLSHGECRET